jgi:hypothetical protein
MLMFKKAPSIFAQPRMVCQPSWEVRTKPFSGPARGKSAEFPGTLGKFGFFL